MEKQRPEGVPAEATWSPGDREWVLYELDSEGRKHGLATFWRPDGTLVNHCQFVEGRPHGWYKRYHESGEVSREGTFVSGKLHGTDVFIRSEQATTENFPAGLSERVWRAEMDMCDNRVLAGRCYDKEGRQVSETGEPYPERPEGVPENAQYSAQGGRWLLGETDENFQRHGLWSFYGRQGGLQQHSLFEHGAELWSRRYDSAEEAAAELALQQGRGAEALEAARGLWAKGPSGAEELAVAADLLLRATRAAEQAPDQALRDAAEQVRRECPGRIVGPFTASGKKGNLALGRVLGFLASEKLERGGAAEALELVNLALEQDYHYGTRSLGVLKFRILKSLERDDEAFAVARGLLAADPNTEGLEDLAASPEFADWLKSISAEHMSAAGAWDVLGERGERLAELVRFILMEKEREGGEGNPDLEWDAAQSLGERLSPELKAFVAQGLADKIQATYRGEFFGAANAGVSQAVAAEDGTWIARLQTCFLPASMVLAEDEEYWIAAWHPNAQGCSRIYTQHQDEPEFSRHSASLAAFLTGRMLEDTGFEELVIPTAIRERWAQAAALIREDDQAEFPGHLDVQVMEARTGWIVDLLLGIQLRSGLEGAAGMEDWEREKDLVAAWPHLQAYWLLHHLVFDNAELLPEVLERADERHPAVAELARLARQVLEGGETEAEFWDARQARDTRVKALDEGWEGLFSAEAKDRLRADLADRDEADAKLNAAKAGLVKEPTAEKVFELFGILESAAGNLEAVEQELCGQVFSDMDEQMDYTMRQRSGHVSILARIMWSFASDLGPAWRDFFTAHLERGADFDEGHASAVPGAIFGLGLALGDFHALMEIVRAQPFYPDRFGRRRRLEAALVARLLEQGDDFLIQEAERYAAQFNQWQVDTAGLALSSLMEAEHPEAPRILSGIFQAADFSGANWKTSILMVKTCSEHPLPGYVPGLLAALDKGLGRHDDGERAMVARAYAVCAGSEGVPELKQRLETIDDVRADCARAGLLAGLVQAAPADEAVAKDAKDTIGRLLEGEMGSMEFGAAVSLLQAVHEKELKGFGDLADSVLERGRVDKYAKKPLVNWLEEHHARFG